MKYVNSGSLTTKMLYDGADCVADYNSNDSLLRYYITPMLDENLLQHQASDSADYFYTHDGLGSVKQIVDSSQTTQNDYDFYAFGTNNGTPTENITNRFKFTGREFDPETTSANSEPLYYYRARMFDSDGSFTSRDPLGEVGSNNLYSYVNNNPTNYTDPFGLINYFKEDKLPKGYYVKTIGTVVNKIGSTQMQTTYKSGKDVFKGVAYDGICCYDVELEKSWITQTKTLWGHYYNFQKIQIVKSKAGQGPKFGKRAVIIAAIGSYAAMLSALMGNPIGLVAAVGLCIGMELVNGLKWADSEDIDISKPFWLRGDKTNTQKLWSVTRLVDFYLEGTIHHDLGYECDGKSADILISWDENDNWRLEKVLYPDSITKGLDIGLVWGDSITVDEAMEAVFKEKFAAMGPSAYSKGEKYKSQIRPPLPK